MIPLLVVVLGAYAAICLVVFLSQARLVYFPDRSTRADPRSIGLEAEELELVASDGVRSHGWFLAAKEARGALLFCHGNAGNVSHRFAAAEVFLEMGVCVLLFDYRGYGASDGSPSEEGTYRDAEAAYDALRARGFAPRSIALYGESLGGGVAIELARRREVACIVTESTFCSVPDLGAEIYPWLPVRLLARIRYDNLSKIGELRVPILIAHSPADEIVPFDHSRRLFDRANEPKRFLETVGGHNGGGFANRATDRELVRDFLQQSLGEREH